MYKLQEPGGRSDGERRAGRAFFDAESSGVDAYGATDLPEVLPSRLTAAAEVLRSAHAARRSGQWPVIDDAQAVIAVSRRQQAADADQQHDKLVFQQAQEVTQQPIVQRFNRAALDQRKRVAATDVQSAGDGPIDKSASPATPHPQQSLPLPVPEELDDIERQARAEFDRYARLANKLDPTLLACLDPGWIAQNRARLNDAGTHATALSTRRGTTSNSADPTLDHALPLPAAQVSDDPAIVAVRLSKCTPGVIDSLRAAGLEVLSTSPADSIVIGRLALLDVERVAELEEVLFVQRAQLQAAPPQRRPASQDGE